MLLAPPDSFDGFISEFIDRYVVPSFPAPEVLFTWAQAVLEYHAAADPICIVRGTRKGELRRIGAYRIVESDNAPGIWCYLRALDRTFNAQDLAAAIETGTVPVLAMLKGEAKRDWSWNYSKQALSPKDSAQLWDRRLKHCHILPARQEPGLTPPQRAMRNIAPINHFVFPNLKHYAMSRIGWSEARPHADLGESERVISWVQHRLAQHLGSSIGKIYKVFLDAAGGNSLLPLPLDGRIQIQMNQVRPNTELEPPSSPRLLIPNSGTPRTWTMNSNLDYYVKTNESQSVIDLNLRYKNTDGREDGMGRYILDLATLAERGIVTRRGNVYDIKVLKDRGQFWIGIRQSPRLLLSDFSVR